jgi:hypothetical protein
MKSATENPTLKASALTVRLVEPLSRIRKNNAEARLLMMRMKPMATMIFMMGPRIAAHAAGTEIADQDTL